MLINLILAGGCLSHTAIAQTYRPKILSDSLKDGAPAQWAPGHPKTWGQETFHLRSATRNPEETFDVAISDDEKYIAITNGTHMQLTDVAKNATAATLLLPQLPETARTGHGNLRIRPTAQGGYLVLYGYAYATQSDFNIVEKTVHLRIGADLQPLGAAQTLEGRYSSVRILPPSHMTINSC